MFGRAGVGRLVFGSAGEEMKVTEGGTETYKTKAFFLGDEIAAAAIDGGGDGRGGGGEGAVGFKWCLMEDCCGAWCGRVGW